MTDYKPLYDEGGPPPSYGTEYPPAQGVPPPQHIQPQQQQYPYSGGVQPSQTVIVTAPSMVFGETSVQLRCPNCHQDVLTTITYEAGMLTFIFVVVLFLIGGICCFWIPLLIDGLKDVNHTCPNCRFKCGTYKRL